MKLKEIFHKIFENIKKALGERKYALKVVDIRPKRNLIFVDLKCFDTNTPLHRELSKLMGDDELLAQIAPREIKLLCKTWLIHEEQTADNKYKLVFSEDGVFVCTFETDYFYAFDELSMLVEDEHLMASIDSKSAYILGKLIGEKSLSNSNTIHLKSKIPEIYLVEQRKEGIHRH